MRFHPFLNAVCAPVRYLIDLDFCQTLKLNDATTKAPVRARNQADSEKLVSATAKSGNATAMT
jgi:hypothetical protein